VTLFDTKADNADVETLRTEVQTALLTKADNADVETLRGEIEVRLDNLETKVDAILSSLKTAGVMASA
jgi:porphobilinogen deaminase